MNQKKLARSAQYLLLQFGRLQKREVLGLDNTEWTDKGAETAVRRRKQHARGGRAAPMHGGAASPFALRALEVVDGHAQEHLFAFMYITKFLAGYGQETDFCLFVLTIVLPT